MIGVARAAHAVTPVRRGFHGYPIASGGNVFRWRGTSRDVGSHPGMLGRHGILCFRTNFSGTKETL